MKASDQDASKAPTWEKVDPSLEVFFYAKMAGNKLNATAI